MTSGGPIYAAPSWTIDYGGKPVIVLGAAPCVLSDMVAARAAYPEADLFALKSAIIAAPNITHFFSAHCDRVGPLMKLRADAGLSPVPFVHTMLSGRRIPTGPPTHIWHGVLALATSVQSAIQIARHMHYGLIILAGCPMDQPGYYPGEVLLPGVKYDSVRIGKNVKSPHANTMRARFAKFVQGAKDIRSMSGFTKEVCGGVDRR